MHGATRSFQRLLGDAPDRSYAAKLDRFGHFVTPELRRIFSDLRLPARGAVLDLGCGTGRAVTLLSEMVPATVVIAGLDLSLPHLRAAESSDTATLLQGDAENLCFRDRVLDLIWTCNTINHIDDRIGALRSISRCLRPDGRLAIAQTGLLPEMYFSWDTHLDDAVRTASHLYYRERYGLTPEDTASVRAIVGLMKSAGFREVHVRTYVVERVQPLSLADRDYFEKAVADGLWRDKVMPLLDNAERRRLERNCDKNSGDYWLDRDDFHHLQTLTVCEARKPHL